MCVFVRLTCLVRHAGRKLLVEGKEKSWTDGRPTHRFSCSQELISLSSSPWVARDTNTSGQLKPAEGCGRDFLVVVDLGTTEGTSSLSTCATAAKAADF